MRNVDIIHQTYEDFSRGDIPQVLGAFSPDIEWVEAAGFVYAGTYVGAEAIVQKVFVRMGTEWDFYRVEPEAVIGEGDQVAALGWYTGRYKATGLEFHARFVHWWTVVNGRITRFEQIVDSVKVAEAIGPPLSPNPDANGHRSEDLLTT
jgi:ketosteroid isomerase-like protein